MDVTALADGFADLGLTCAVLSPSGADEDVERIVQVGRQADILVLDWRLNEETGQTAVDVVEQLAAVAHHGRRLLVIYTTWPPLDDILRQIRSRIASPQVPEGRELTLDSRGLRITVYAKPSRSANDRFAHRERNAATLPETVVSEFAELCRGLVPATTLHALAATRENTHRLLDRLDHRLDVGFAGHTLRLAHHEEAVDHLLDAISGELRAIVEDDSPARASAGTDAVERWYAERGADIGLTPQQFAEVMACEPRKLKELLIKMGTSERRLTTSLVPNNPEQISEAKASDAMLAMLLALRRPYGDARLPLHLGTIVRETRHPDFFWLCLQPVCDSVRLHKPTLFPMLQLDLAEDGDKPRFNIAVRDVDQSVKLLYSRGKPQDIEAMQFSPTEGTVRFASTPDKAERTTTTADGLELVWIAQLKPAHSQRVAERLSAELSRVGLDESDWLRRREQETPAPVPIDRRALREARRPGRSDQ